MSRLYKAIFFAMACVMSSCSEGVSGKAEITESPVDERMVLSLRGTDRLYTTEYVVNKAVTYDDIVKLKGSILSKKFDLKIPQGDRKIIIPMEARLKAYIDFSDFSKKNIIFSPDSSHVRIILPDPKVELTSTRIDHAGVLTFVDFGRSRFSGAEMSALERQGRAAIIAAIPEMDIIETARQDAYSVVLPLAMAMGYAAEQVTVDFRSDFSSDEYLKSFVNSISRD